jgi:hypothetical protein
MPINFFGNSIVPVVFDALDQAMDMYNEKKSRQISARGARGC